jgi:hypothetical protein
MGPTHLKTLMLMMTIQMTTQTQATILTSTIDGWNMNGDVNGEEEVGVEIQPAMFG